MTENMAREQLTIARRLGCTSVHIGGGEPLLSPDCVAMVLDIARTSGVSVEYVETNSSWYRDERSACAMLRKLVEHGLTTLLVSISPFHNEYIPFRKVKGVLEACRIAGMSVVPWVADFIHDLSSFDETRTHTLEDYEDMFGEGYIEDLSRRYWIAPGGRALDTFAPYAPKIPLAELFARENSACSELSHVTHFHLDLYGNYIPGLCAGLSINASDLGSPLREYDYPIITRLYTGGVAALCLFAAKKYGFEPSQPAYVSKCHLCYEIRRFLAVDMEVESRELSPAGHYRYG
jgi:hypothetical protein